MDLRVRVLLAFLFVAAGFLAVLFGVPFVGGLIHTEAEWREQVEADIETAVQFLDADRRTRIDSDGTAEFTLRWDRHLVEYDAERRANLRSGLELYLEFLTAEYADAADIYASGAEPPAVSESARAIRGRIAADLGALGEDLLEDANRMREDAYRNSPAHSGYDPALTDFKLEDSLLRDWLPRARELVEHLTADPDNRTQR